MANCLTDRQYLELKNYFCKIHSAYYRKFDQE
jgi:hypothetical protein